MVKISYSAILGLKPSKGARSPKLWNKAYNHFHIKCKMVPIDIKEKNFQKKINSLKKDKNFIGGAITIPYKEKILKHLKGNFDRKVKRIGAVNCLIRDKKGNLYGTNTDGEAALINFRKKTLNKNIKNFVILGYGGVGKAVTTYFAEFYKKSNFFVYVRKKNQKNYQNVTFLKWDDFSNKLHNIDALINCTSIGFLNNKSPLNSSQVSKLNKKIIIFDVIYQPRITSLIKLANKNNIKNFNGLEMNLEQAALAFKKTNHIKYNSQKIKKVMR